MENPELEHKRFIIRLTAVFAAVILILFLAKAWFVDPLRITDDLGARVISWQDAAKHYGEYVTVEGKIVASHNSGKVCFLNFHKDYKLHFTAVIFASAYALFPDKPQNYYLGKTVRVSGHIKEYNGKPEIILNDPGQIKILQ